MAGHEEEAELCAKKVFDLSQFGERWGEVSAYRVLAVVAAEEKPADWNKVDEYMKQSLQWAQERGCRPEQAISCFRYAELLCNKGDLEQTIDYLTQAIDLFTEMNMTWWLEQAKKLRSSLPSN